MSILLHPAIPRFRRYIYGVLAVIDRLLPHTQQVVILAYHSIGRDGWRFSVSFDEFCQQIERILALGYEPITLERAARSLGEGLSLPPKSFVVTFDDGYRDVLLVAHFLKLKKVHPAIFVLADREKASREELGTDRQFLSKHEIRELHAAGWEIGCHSATHTDFSRLNTSVLEHETKTAKIMLEQELGIPIRFFAYPKGYYDEQIRSAVCSAGYQGALSMDDGFIGRDTDLFALPRVGVDRTHGVREFSTLFLPTVVAFRAVVKSFLHLLQSVRAGHEQRFSHRIE